MCLVLEVDADTAARPQANTAPQSKTSRSSAIQVLLLKQLETVVKFDTASNN
jgi:hypothetical protein